MHTPAEDETEPNSGADGPGEPSVVVVGNGAAGTLVVIGLLRSATREQTRLRISWIGEDPAGRGVAYSTPSPWHRLNVASAQMCQAEGPDDLLESFPDWLAERGAGADDFAARWDFGSYLADLLADALRAAGDLVTLDEVRRRAVALSTDDRSVHVELDDGAEVVAGRAVLALGLFPPAPLPGLTDAAAAHPRLLADPWNGRLEQVQGTGDAVLVGTGLTMVDVALTLSRQAPDLRLRAVSRTGLTPRAHELEKTEPGAPAAAPRPDLTLTELVTAVDDLVAADPDRWRDVVDGLRPVTQDLWRSLSPDDQERFLREHARRWEVHRHRMAPSVAEEFDTLIDDGDLRTSTSAVQAIDAAGSQLLVQLQHEEVRADWVISCTGPQPDVTATGDPLVTSLLSGGHARPHRLGLGFDTTANGALVTAGGASERLFTLGSLRRGELYETTAIPEIGDQARELADVLLAAETGS